MINITSKKLKTFELPELQPEGWLKRQFEIQMNGLTGQLYDLWDSVGSYSGWLGGTGENWERGPYYLDGLLPLSWYLEDKEHYAIVKRFIDWTLNSQDEEGNFGPVSSKHDYWSRFVMLKVLIQYYEIEKDNKVLILFKNYFHYLYKAMQIVPPSQWAKARIGDLLYSIEWYYEKEPNTEILNLVEILKSKALDWVDFFEDFPYVRPTKYYHNWKKELSHFSKDQLEHTINYHSNHIVNVAMGFKYPSMLSYFYNDKDYEAISLKGLESAEKYHGVASGAINGDEHLSGNNPSQGAELCSIVEYMFSLQTMLERFGNPVFADKLERLAYNALPATITEDFMGHQYLQQANQVLVSKAERSWFNTNDESNIFGLEPNFGCCTANMHQGWPKFIKNLWFEDEDSNLVSMVFAPSKLRTKINENMLCVKMETQYPFDNIIKYSFEEANHICLKIRVPEWCDRFTLTKNGTLLAEDAYQLKEGFLFVEDLNSMDVIEFVPAMEVRKSFWYHNSLSIERGPLLYALDIKERWKPIKEIAGVKDYEIYSESPWNYAINNASDIDVKKNDMGDIPFSKANPSTILTVSGSLLEEWQLEKNSAGDLPISPVEMDEGFEEKINLIPFGCTKLRVSQFPYYNR